MIRFDFGFILFPTFTLLNGVDVFASISENGEISPCTSPPTPCASAPVNVTPCTTGVCSTDYVCVNGVGVGCATNVCPCFVCPTDGVQDGCGMAVTCGGVKATCKPGDKQQVCEAGTKNFWGMCTTGVKNK